MRIDTSLKCLFITLVLYVPCWYEFSRYKSQPVPLVSMDEVNQWVENVTNGHIPNFLESIPHDVVLMLMNAVYFKGDPLHKTKLFIIVFYSQRKDGTKLNPCSLTGQINQSFLKGEKSSQNCENCKKKICPGQGGHHSQETVPLSYNQTAHCANQGSISCY